LRHLSRLESWRPSVCINGGQYLPPFPLPIGQKLIVYQGLKRLNRR
jgi:hypothetical protein